MLRETLRKISQEFTPSLNEEYVGHPLADFIRNEGPQVVHDLLPPAFAHFQTKGSCGQDKWASKRGAWINIMNPAITNGASQGYYLVYGFPAGTTEFVFGLSQGYTEARKMYGSNWEDAVENTASRMRLFLPKHLLADFNIEKPKFKFQFDTNDKGYRVGYALHRIYDSADLPEEETLLSDLNKLLEAYKIVFEANGDSLYRDHAIDPNVLEKQKPYEEDEDKYQHSDINQKHLSIRQSNSANLTTAEKRSLIGLKPKTKARPRNPVYAEIARIDAGYQCEISSSHSTFLRKKDHQQYTEAHHLIPYSQFDEYAEKGLSIDRPINIVSLCPNCHRKIHHGTNEDIRELVSILFDQRKEKIMQTYNCDEKELFKFYNV